MAAFLGIFGYGIPLIGVLGLRFSSFNILGAFALGTAAYLVAFLVRARPSLGDALTQHKVYERVRYGYSIGSWYLVLAGTIYGFCWLAYSVYSILRRA